MKKDLIVRMKHKDKVTIPWYRSIHRKNFSYYDEDLKLWFVIMYNDKTKKEIQGAGQTRERAYNRMKAGLRGKFPELKQFPVYTNLEKTFTYVTEI